MIIDEIKKSKFILECLIMDINDSDMSAITKLLIRSLLIDSFKQKDVEDE